MIDEHLVIWIVTFMAMSMIIGDFKEAIKATIIFLIMLYAILGLYYYFICNGGYLPV